MLTVLWQCRGAFIAEGEKDKPIDYWLNMLESQLAEARMHLARGEIERCRHEISDHVLVAFHALDDTGPENPEVFVAESVRRRVLPKVAHLMHVYGANGYKHGVKPPQTKQVKE